MCNLRMSYTVGNEKMSLLRRNMDVFINKISKYDVYIICVTVQVGILVSLVW